MNEFNALEVKNKCVEWIRNWFEVNGNECTCVIGISGGKDSSVVVALCVEALGKDRVFGVLMPNGLQTDIDYSYLLCNHLEIEFALIPIGHTINTLKYDIISAFADGDCLSDQAEINLPARIRMATLYAVSQSMNGRVANTCNLSEDYIGYSTRYGDSAGDFSPLANLTVTEVKQIGRVLGLPGKLIDKTPSDGLCGKSDEDNFGFTYDALDRYIRTGQIEDEEVKRKIDYLHDKNKFKLEPMPSFKF